MAPTNRALRPAGVRASSPPAQQTTPTRTAPPVVAAPARVGASAQKVIPATFPAQMNHARAVVPLQAATPTRTAAPAGASEGASRAAAATSTRRAAEAAAGPPSPRCHVPRTRRDARPAGALAALPTSPAVDNEPSCGKRPDQATICYGRTAPSPIKGFVASTVGLDSRAYASGLLAHRLGWRTGIFERLVCERLLSS
jgi:hypothetical protein